MVSTSGCAAAVLAAAPCIALALAACSGPAAPTRNTAADLASIRAFNTRYLAAINSGNSAALARLTGDNHVMIAGGRPPVVGKAANDAANRRTLKRLKIGERWFPIETVIASNLAYQRGTFTVVASPKGGGPARTMHGNYLRIYRRRADGTWIMTRDMFASDSPPLAN